MQLPGDCVVVIAGADEGRARCGNAAQFQGDERDVIFISVGYGIGQAYWYSKLTHSSIYDKGGSAIQSGTFKFRANNTSTFTDINVLFPVGKFRLGLGLNFEKFFLTKMEVKETITTRPS